MATLTAIYERLTGWLDLSSWMQVESTFQDGLIAGIALMLVLILLLWLILYRLLHRPSTKAVTVAGEHGNLTITVGAIREFVTRILSEFGDASLHSVRLRQNRKRLVMDIEIAVVPDTDLIPLRDMLQVRIMKDASVRLGLTMPLRVNIRVKSLQADQAKIARKAKNQGNTSRPAETADIFEDYDSMERQDG